VTAGAITWLVLAPRGQGSVVDMNAIPRLPVRSLTAWLLVAMFLCVAVNYYGLSAWLPNAYQELGWSEGHAAFDEVIAQEHAAHSSSLPETLTLRAKLALAEHQPALAKSLAEEAIASLETAGGHDQPMLWDVDSRDWAGAPADRIAAVAKARGGVVLLHLHGANTPEAVRLIG